VTKECEPCDKRMRATTQLTNSQFTSHLLRSAQDLDRSDCKAPELDAHKYDIAFGTGGREGSGAMRASTAEEKAELFKADTVLGSLLEGAESSSLVSRVYSHDNVLEHVDEEIANEEEEGRVRARCVP